MRIELVNTGTELLLGKVINTHVRLIAEALFPLGLRIGRQVAAPDGPPIRDAILETFGRADLVLVTGGLGPTTDDLTREITAELLGLELIHDEEIMQAIHERFARRALKVTDRIGRQAQRPREAVVLPNRNGTAPGLFLASQDTAARPHLILLPGPPRELEPMFRDSVLPILQKLAPAGSSQSMRTYQVIGLGESSVEARVGEDLLALGLELGYCARPGAVDVRTIGDADQLQRAQQIIQERLGEFIFSEDDRPLEKVIIDLLAGRSETLATAESCTGGGLADRLTNVPGASAVFVAGYVTYANEAKVNCLGVASALIEEHGAVSAPVARAMAEGARRESQADYALATTGIAGPDGGTPEKPVGTVFIALARKDGETQVRKHHFPTDRATFKQLVAQTAFALLLRAGEGIP